VPIQKKASIQDMIRIWADIGAHHIDGAALTASLKEVTYPSKKGGKGT
jgi:hypothetical protein